jgi:hypothetical protein
MERERACLRRGFPHPRGRHERTEMLRAFISVARARCRPRGAASNARGGRAPQLRNSGLTVAARRCRARPARSGLERPNRTRLCRARQGRSHSVGTPHTPCAPETCGAGRLPRWPLSPWRARESWRQTRPGGSLPKNFTIVKKFGTTGFWTWYRGRQPGTRFIAKTILRGETLPESCPDQKSGGSRSCCSSRSGGGAGSSRGTSRPASTSS